MSSPPSTKKRTELFRTLMGDISSYLRSAAAGSKHNSEAKKLLQRVEHIQHKVKETEKARAATVAAAEVAVQAAAAAQRAAEEESPFGFESNNNSPDVNPRFAGKNVNALERFRRKSKRASKGGKRAATRRR